MDPVTRAPAEVVRFDATERLVHWTSALLLLVLFATGTILYIPSLMLDVGHRATIVNIHVIAGLALLAPLVIGLVLPWRGGLLDDLRRLDVWRKVDSGWYRTPSSHDGKFNGGQKLMAGALGGGMVAMLLTGVVMRWSPPFPNYWARGATLVHDLVYLLLGVLVLAHVSVAVSRPVQLRSMFTGRVPRSWAERHPGWLHGRDLAPPRAAASPRPLASAHRGAAAAAGGRPGSGSA